MWRSLVEHSQEDSISSETPCVEELLCRAAENQRTRVERQAYEIFLSRGESDGYDVDDWLQARRALLG
jgi:hypothetical protein